MGGKVGKSQKETHLSWPAELGMLDLCRGDDQHKMVDPRRKPQT